MKRGLPSWLLIIVPISLLVLGFSANKICVVANHGQMPVLWPGGCGDEIWNEPVISHMIMHKCITYLGQARLRFLCDWILLSGNGVESPGDMMLDGGFYSIGPAFFMWLTLVLEELGYIRRSHLFKPSAKYRFNMPKTISNTSQKHQKQADSHTNEKHHKSPQKRSFPLRK